jgi:hypothetical protein
MIVTEDKARTLYWLVYRHHNQSSLSLELHPFMLVCVLRVLGPRATSLIASQLPVSLNARPS